MSRALGSITCDKGRLPGEDEGAGFRSPSGYFGRGI